MLKEWVCKMVCQQGRNANVIEEEEKKAVKAVQTVATMETV